MAREMKDSGIPWIGIIPIGWKVSPLKTSIRWKSEKNHEDAQVLSLYRDYGVIPKDSRDDNYNVTSLDTSGYKYVEAGDLVVNKMKAWQGSIAVSDYDGIVSPAYHVCKITNDRIVKKYLHYLLRNSSYLPEYMRLSTGLRIGQWDLGYDDFRNIPIILPPIEEQQRIVSYIDTECARIDEVIGQTRVSIEEYKKLKQSVITEAVTKGIRKDRPMKESGIEWVGEIPEGWDVVRLKSLFEFGKGLPITKDNLVESGVAVISYGQIHSKLTTGVELQPHLIRYVGEEYIYSCPRSLVHEGDFIFADTSEDLDGCGNAVYVDTEGMLFAGYHTIIFFSKNKADNKYLAYQFRTDAWRSQIRSKVSGVKLFSISRKILSETSCIVPSQEEANQIVEYLDQKCSEIDEVVATKDQLIKELETYKKSLIYEYVTGKKEVLA